MPSLPSHPPSKTHTRTHLAQVQELDTGLEEGRVNQGVLVSGVAWDGRHGRRSQRVLVCGAVCSDAHGLVAARAHVERGTRLVVKASLARVPDLNEEKEEEV